MNQTFLDKARFKVDNQTEPMEGLNTVIKTMGKEPN